MCVPATAYRISKTLPGFCYTFRMSEWRQDSIAGNMLGAFMRPSGGRKPGIRFLLVSFLAIVLSYWGYGVYLHAQVAQHYAPNAGLLAWIQAGIAQKLTGWSLLITIVGGVFLTMALYTVMVIRSAPVGSPGTHVEKRRGIPGYGMLAAILVILFLVCTAVTIALLRTMPF